MNNKGQMDMMDLCVVILVLGGLAFGGFTLWHMGYDKGYAAAVKDRPTYEVKDGGKVNVEAQCSGIGIHFLKYTVGVCR